MRFESLGSPRYYYGDDYADHIKDLKEALKPFAALLAEHHERMPNEQPLFGINDALITVGDVRRAVELTKE
jgi:hypothetical protein